MILDLLTRNYEGGKKKGVTFDNILVHLKRRYQITQPGQAEEALEVYLDQLKGFGLLQQKTDSDWIDDLDHFENYVPKPGHPGAEKGNIEGGATLICCGSPINWTRP